MYGYIIIIIIIVIVIAYSMRNESLTGYPRMACPAGTSYLPGVGCVKVEDPIFIRK